MQEFKTVFFPESGRGVGENFVLTLYSSVLRVVKKRTWTYRSTEDRWLTIEQCSGKVLSVRGIKTWTENIWLYTLWGNMTGILTQWAS